MMTPRSKTAIMRTIAGLRHTYISRGDILMVTPRMPGYKLDRSEHISIVYLVGSTEVRTLLHHHDKLCTIAVVS